MVENYMDYSNDACMNMYTAKQSTVMRAVLELPRPGLIEGQDGEEDVAGLAKILKGFAEEPVFDEEHQARQQGQHADQHGDRRELAEEILSAPQRLGQVKSQ